MTSVFVLRTLAWNIPHQCLLTEVTTVDAGFFGNANIIEVLKSPDQDTAFRTRGWSNSLALKSFCDLSRQDTENQGVLTSV